jgi:acyl carrier protein
MAGETVRDRLAGLVAAACDGEVTAAEAAAAPSLALIGVNSLASLRLIDAVEREFGVVLDLDSDPAMLDSVDTLAGYLAARGIPADAD